MKKDCFSIRRASVQDAAALLEIYTPFVVSEDRALSDVSFEYEAPGVEEFAGRIKHISASYPYLVCELDGKPVGYAYAHPYIERAAYQWGAEVTIYLSPAAQGKGVGRRLYTALEKILRLQNVLTCYACVTASNEHSVKMHEALGYHIAGSFKNAGFKHGHWLDMVWLEKQLAVYPENPELFKSINQVEQAKVEAIVTNG